MIESLTRIRAFINTYAEGDQVNRLAPEIIDEMQLFVSGSLIALRSSIDQELISKNNTDDLTQYVRTLQISLTALIDDLSVVIPVAGNEVGDIFKSISEELIKLLHYQFTYFGYLFSVQVAPPSLFVIHWKKAGYYSAQKLLEELQKKLKDEELVNLVQSYLESIDPDDRFFVRTWEQWQFFLHFSRQLRTLLNSPGEDDFRLQLLKFLIAQNFNCVDIYGYFLKYMEGLFAVEESGEIIQQQLFYLLKVYRQVNVNSKFSYDQQEEPLKTMVIGCIVAELEYLDQQEKHLIKSYTEPEPGKPAKFYFTVMVTIAELMFLLKVMVRTKFIVTKFNSHLYSFVNNHIRTQRAEHPSKKGMRNHFSAKPVADRIVQAVREWLKKMIDYIDDNYKY